MADVSFPVFALVCDHGVAVELFRRVANPYPELGRAGPAATEGLRENGFARRRDRDETDVLALGFVEPDVAQAGCRYRKIGVEVLA